MGLKQVWITYRRDLKSLWNILLASLLGVMLVFAKDYLDSFFYYAGIFFKTIGSIITFFFYIPRNAPAYLLKPLGFLNFPENILTLIIVIGLAILVMPLMKLVFQFGDTIQDWLYKQIRWKK